MVSFVVTADTKLTISLKQLLMKTSVFDDRLLKIILFLAE